MSEEKIGMYTAEEIYEELANGFLHHSMVDAMYFQIKDLQQKVEELENIRKEAIKFINEWLFEAGGNGADMDYDTIVDLLNILNKGSEEK